MMIRGRRDRSRAKSLQEALERYERALDAGSDEAQARIDTGRALGELGPTFALAVALGDSGREITPDPAFARRVAMQLRSAQVVRQVKRRRAPRFTLAPLGFAAAAIAAAVVLIPSLQSLPGDPLYAVKDTAEDARVWFARGSGEARVRLNIAEERFVEVERLIDRARVIVAGPGVTASAAADIDDPELARLIESTLQEAGKQLEAAADILTSEPAEQQDIAALLHVTQRGRDLTAEVAEELPNRAQPPVLLTGVKLAKIEAQAKAAQTQPTAASTPPPCATPSPTPTPTPTPTATPAEDEATPSPTPSTAPDGAQPPPASPEEEQTLPTTEPTPCVSPSPTPTPAPTPTPTAEATPEPSPGETEVQGSSVENDEDGQGSEESEEPEPTPRPGRSPSVFDRA